MIYSNSKRLPMITSVFNFFLPGAGLLLLGQWKKGIVLFLIFLLPYFINRFFTISVGVLFFVIRIIKLLEVGDAYGTALKLNNGNPIKEWEININWVVVGVATLFDFFVLPPLRLIFLSLFFM